MSNRPAGRRSLRLTTYCRGALALLAVVVVGAVDLIAPTLGDQALYRTYANKLAAGGVLYGDVWDIKQPGIRRNATLLVTMFRRFNLWAAAGAGLQPNATTSRRLPRRGPVKREPGGAAATVDLC